MELGRLVILSGPSGVGKDTVIDAWKAQNPSVHRVVAYTTRAPRPGEVHRVDYNFVTYEDFHAKALAGDFLEFKEVHGNWYATPLADLDAMLEDGKVAILKIDVQGALTAMEKRSDALSIFILPPSAEELERRIRGRASDAPEAIVKRLENALAEVAMAGKYQYQVVNRSVEETVEELERIIQ